MYRFRRFLLVDDDEETRFLHSRTLLRKFPQSNAVECIDADAALSAAAEQVFDAVITHLRDTRANSDLIRALRRIQPDVPILALTEHPALARAFQQSGATRVHHVGQWLLVGVVVEEMLREQRVAATAARAEAPV